MADFTNPGILGTIENFRKNYQSPILNGREPDADDKTREKGQIAQVLNVYFSILSESARQLIVCYIPVPRLSYPIFWLLYAFAKSQTYQQ